MEDLITRKRRSGLLCSKKEIILSRSLGAENSSGRNSSRAITGVESKNQNPNIEKKAKCVPEQLPPPPAPVTFFPYTEQDRKRDEDILNRFDQAIGFDDFKAIELSRLDIVPKKRRLLRSTLAKENQTNSAAATDPEIIDLVSTTVDNINTRLRSKETSSDLQISKSTRASPARRRIKNTIPSDNFERYLASIVKRYPPMTERDRVMFWKFTPDPNDDEFAIIDNSADLILPQNPFSRKIFENNNKNPCLPVVDDCRNNININNRSSENNSVQLTVNTISNDLVHSENIASGDSKHCTVSRDNSNTMNSFSRREPLRVYGNARQIKQKSSNKGSLDSGFKIPSNPDNSNNALIATPNKLDMSTAQKEEFYKYLGLETTSPNGKTDTTNEKTNKKRRSLRVRQMQLQQETNRKAKERRSLSPPKVEEDERKESEKRQRLSSEVDTSPPNKSVVEAPRNKDLQDHLQQPSEREASPSAQREASSSAQREASPSAQRETSPSAQREASSSAQREASPSAQREASPSAQRRTCGSLIRSLSSGRPESRSTTILHIIERIDYSKSFNGSDSIINSPDTFQQIHTETALNNNNIKTNEQIPEPILRYNTRMSRRNGTIASRKVCPVTCKEPMQEDVDSNPPEMKKSKDGKQSESAEKKEITDIIEVGRKCREKLLQEKVPIGVSCVEHIAYEKPVRLREIEEKFLQVEEPSPLFEEDNDKMSIQSNAPDTPKSHLSEERQSDEVESVQSDLLGFDESSLQNFHGFLSNSIIVIDDSSQEQMVAKTNDESYEPKSLIKSIGSISRPSSEKELFETAVLPTEPKLLIDKNIDETSFQHISEPNLSDIDSRKNRSLRKKNRGILKNKLTINNHMTEDNADEPVINDGLDTRSLELRNSKLQWEPERKQIDASPLKCSSHTGSPKKHSKHKTSPKQIKGKWNKKIKRSKMLKLIRKCVNKSKLKKQNDKPIPPNVIETIEDLSKLELTEEPSPEFEVFPEVAPAVEEEVTSPPANGVCNESSEDMFQGIESSPLKTSVPNALPNPLEKSAGAVLHGFYEGEMLIIVQERKVSFWKYFKALRMLGQPQDWLLLGEHDRLLNDMEVITPCKNRLCMNDDNPVYVEMRAKKCADDPFRTCNMASVYVNIYYYNEFKVAVVLHSVSLETIRGVYTDIIYTTITNSREFVMCCKQENILNTIRTGVCKYTLTSDLNTLDSIYEFNTTDYVISQLECLGEDKMIGIGGSRVTIWEHISGDQLIEFEISPSVGDYLGSIFCSAAFQNYLFLYHKDINETTNCPQLVVTAVNLAEYPLDFKVIQKHDLPHEFANIKSSICTDETVVVKSNKSSEFLLLVQQPHRQFRSNEWTASNTERFYSAGSQYFVEISDESLTVKTIHEFLLDFVK